MEKIKILLAEDEPTLGQIVKEGLESRHFEVVLCADGEDALKAFHRDKPNLLILDVMMPKKDGFTLASEIRKTDLQTPIIFLTAKSQTQDVVSGFRHGGNDYLRKPFSMEELFVRIDALLNRVATSEEAVNIGGYIFNYPQQTLSFEGAEDILTAREAALLWHLHQFKNQILDKTYILKKLWGNDDPFNARSMDVFITKLRKKLAKDASVKIINVRGSGYKLLC